MRKLVYLMGAAFALTSFEANAVSGKQLLAQKGQQEQQLVEKRVEKLGGEVADVHNAHKLLTGTSGDETLQGKMVLLADKLNPVDETGNKKFTNATLDQLVDYNIDFNKKIQEEYKKSRDAYKELVDKYKLLLNENKQVKKECKVLFEENTKIREQYSALEEKNTKIREQYSALEEKNTKIREQYSALEEQNTVLSDSILQANNGTKVFLSEISKLVTEKDEEYNFVSLFEVYKYANSLFDYIQKINLQQISDLSQGEASDDEDNVSTNLNQPSNQPEELNKLESAVVEEFEPIDLSQGGDSDDEDDVSINLNQPSNQPEELNKLDLDDLQKFEPIDLSQGGDSDDEDDVSTDLNQPSNQPEELNKLESAKVVEFKPFDFSTLDEEVTTATQQEDDSTSELGDVE